MILILYKDHEQLKKYRNHEIADNYIKITVIKCDIIQEIPLYEIYISHYCE